MSQRVETQSARERRSARSGGFSIGIKRAIEAGKTYNQISEEFGAKKLAQSRKTLRAWSVEVPYYPHMSPEERAKIEQQLRDTSSSDKIIQKNLNRVTARMYWQNVQDPDGVVCSVDGIFKSVGVIFKRYEQYDILKRAKIPMGKITKFVKKGPQAGRELVYHFVASQHAERVKTAISEALVE